MSVGEIEVPARPAAAPAEPTVELYSPWRIAWRRFRRDRVGMASGIFLIVLLLAIFPGAKIASTALGHGPDDLFPYAVNSDNLKPLGPWTWVPDTHQLAPTTSDFETPPPPKGTPNTLFLLGADGQLGHDLFLRLLYGGQVSLEVGIGATIIALLIGVTLGMLAGWLGGLVDGAVSRLTDLIMALPILLILLMVGTGIGDGLQRFTFWGVFNNGVVQLMLLIGVFTWYYPARIARSQMQQLRHQEYVEAAADGRGARVADRPQAPLPAPRPVARRLRDDHGRDRADARGRRHVPRRRDQAAPRRAGGSPPRPAVGSALNPTITPTPENFQPWPTIIPSVAILLTVLALNQPRRGASARRSIRRVSADAGLVRIRHAAADLVDRAPPAPDADHVLRLLEDPSQPAAFLIDIRYATPADIEHANHVLGTDKPIYVQYARFVWRALHGDLGKTFRQQRGGFTVSSSTGTPVLPQVLRAGAITGAIALGGAILLFLISVPLGMLAASRPRSTIDRASTGISMLGISTHPLVVALLLQLFLASKWHWLPQTGYCDFIPKGEASSSASFDPQAACSGPVGWAEHLAIPWIVFAVFFVALYSRMIRARMLEALDQDYVRTARAKGAPQRRVLFKHALPNTVLPIVTMLAMDIGTAIGICVYIEAVFRMPGLGLTTLQSMGGLGLDLPMLIGITLFTGTMIIVLNLLVDLFAVIIDPRISQSPRADRRAVLGTA
jgi:peptide/nickel transport system permease protein